MNKAQVRKYEFSCLEKGQYVSSIEASHYRKSLDNDFFDFFLWGQPIASVRVSLVETITSKEIPQV